MPLVSEGGFDPTVSGIPFCRKSERVTQSQNVPVSCLEGHFGTGLLAHFSSAWSNVEGV